MKKIILGRGEGKTQKLIKLSFATNTYILVAGRQRQREVFDMARKMGLHILFPVTVEDYMNNQFRESFIKHILIDDAEDVLQRVFYTVEIDAITLTKDEEERRM